MRFLEQTRNRVLFIAVSSAVTVAMLLAINPAASALSVLLFTLVINALIYVALPEWYESK